MRKRYAAHILTALILGLTCVAKAQDDPQVAPVQEHLHWSLMCAVENGDAAAVQNLLNRGADVKAVNVQGRTALAMAVEGNQIEAVRALIQKGADVNARDYLGLSIWRMARTPEVKKLLEQAGAKTDVASSLSKPALARPKDPVLGKALYEAVDARNLTALTNLLNQGTDINARIDAGGMTPLILAAIYDRTNVVEFLIAHGADVNLPANDRVTPLMCAVQNTRKSDHVVRLLLTNGANVNQPCGWQRTVLFEAAEQNREDMVKLLLAHDADVNAEDEYGRTVLVAAAQKGATSAVKALLDTGKYASAEKQIKAALVRATESSLGASREPRAEIIRLLEAAGGRNAKARTGVTELMQAARAKDLERVKLMLSQGADVNAQGPEGETALMLALGNWQPATRGQLNVSDYAKLAARGDEIALLLLKKGADFLPEDDHRQTAFQIAVNGRRSKVVIALLDRGADRNANYFAYTDLMLAAIANDAVRTKALLAAGAQLHFRAGRYQFGQTAIHFAAGSGTNALLVLIEAGADINAEDIHQRTPLAIAAGAGNLAVARILIEKGALIKGTPALSSAAGSDNLELVKLLLANGASVAPEPGVNPPALTTAAMGPNPDVLRLFLENGGNVDGAGTAGDTLLITAAKFGRTANVKLLLQRGAKVDAKDVQGLTALRWATMQTNIEVADLLRKAGAKE
jgi:ankyrin repeat protein